MKLRRQTSTAATNGGGGGGVIINGTDNHARPVSYPVLPPSTAPSLTAKASNSNLEQCYTNGNKDLERLLAPSPRPALVANGGAPSTLLSHVLNGMGGGGGRESGIMSPRHMAMSPLLPHQYPMSPTPSYASCTSPEPMSPDPRKILSNLDYAKVGRGVWSSLFLCCAVFQECY